jgi:outer membrane protein OmpA-like peptidoglycan-associated protein
MKEKYSRFFWPSFSDLMTSLFYVMMVLFILSTILMKKYSQSLADSRDSLSVNAEKFVKIQQLDSAIQSLPRDLFTYDSKNKRYRLDIDVRFKPNSDSLSTITDVDYVLPKLAEAGNEIYSLIEKLQLRQFDANYLLIIEGHTQKTNDNWLKNPDGGYWLSYKRALALYNFWQKRANLDFKGLSNCEVIIAGSGYFSKSRDQFDEANNRRFTIQITPKFGRFEKDL